MKKIIYITYIDFGNWTSGSQIRPQKMYKAFCEAGYSVELLQGNQKKENRASRKKNIEALSRKIKKGEFEFCYIESPSDPIFLKEDKMLIKKIKDEKIPIMYFYRDAYYKLGKEYFDFSGKSVVAFIKAQLRYYYYKYLFYRDDIFIGKYVDLVYFPTLTMAEYFEFNRMSNLPPAGEILSYGSEEKEVIDAEKEYLIYVGGVSKAYGIDILLEAMALANKKQFIPLCVVCRKGEGNQLLKQYEDSRWLQVVHVSGEGLKDYYNKAKIAVLPKIKSIYSDMSISVKLYEYMGHGLPVLASDVKEQAQIIKKYDMGWLYKNNAKDLSEKILETYNLQELSKYRANVINALKNENLWIHRVEKVSADARKIRSEDERKYY